LLITGFAPSIVEAQTQTVGLFQNDASAFEGYTLFNRRTCGDAYLIDMNGFLVHSWAVGGAGVLYLLENGNLLRGSGGCREYTWDGTVVWDYAYAGQHHDIERLPNGNTLLVVRETILYDDAIAAGRDPALLNADLWSLVIVEIEKTGFNTGTVVWEWRAWDHLIQDYDPGKPDYGVVADHPELIDLNFAATGESDWDHTNAVDYNPELDQIIVSVRDFNELWIIDHSTSTAEAAGHTGGLSGMGGDLLYRWGNPQAYGRGDEGDRQLFLQHDTQWIEEGLPGEGHILIFNNGNGRPAGNYSSIEEIVPPVDGYNYTLGTSPDSVYGPATPLWDYTADPPSDFYSRFISGTQRLANGNTLINSGASGTFFEVTSDGQIVWKYVNPVTCDGPLTQGDAIPDPSGPGLGNMVYRCYRYAPDYPGLAGRDLTPTGPIELYDSTAYLTLQSTTGGSVVNPGEGSFPYGVGQLTTIEAEESTCNVFVDWTVVSGLATLSDPSSMHATFTMENQDTTIQANFTVDPSGDVDLDGVCGGTDNCPSPPNPGQEDVDSDGVGDNCDNCPEYANAGQADSDTDGLGDGCDNCTSDRNPSQSDLDSDHEGDTCDSDDGLIYVFFQLPGTVEWQEETGFTSWNSYRGDLTVLKSTGVYTQAAGSNDLARQDCGLSNPWIDDSASLGARQAAFFLTTGEAGATEGGLGEDSNDITRPNDNPCP
jgi:hypothetical protein